MSAALAREGLLYVVPGHGPRPWYDPGATVGDAHEAVLVRQLAADIEEAAKAAHLTTKTMGSGYYSARNAAALAAAEVSPARRTAVIHLHLNAAGSASARYAMAMHDKRSKGGGTLAALMAVGMKRIKGAPWGGDVRVMPVYNDRASAGDRAWLYRAYGCIDEVYAGPANISACLLECGFLTDPNLRAWWTDENRRELADRIVAGVVEWTGHGQRTKKRGIT